MFFPKRFKLPSTNKRELSSKDESDDQEEEDTIIIKKQRTNVSINKLCTRLKTCLYIRTYNHTLIAGPWLCTMYRPPPHRGINSTVLLLLILFAVYQVEKLYGESSDSDSEVQSQEVQSQEVQSQDGDAQVEDENRTSGDDAGDDADSVSYFIAYIALPSLGFWAIGADFICQKLVCSSLKMYCLGKSIRRLYSIKTVLSRTPINF